MILLKTLLEALPQEDDTLVGNATDKAIAIKARQMIQDFADRNRDSVEDVATRLMGFTSGKNRPNPNVGADINIIPLLNDLHKIGAVRKLPGGGYKSTNPMSMVYKVVNAKGSNNALVHGIEKSGRLGLTPAKGLTAFAGDKPAGEILKGLAPGYKRGQAKSAQATQLTKDAIKNNDPDYIKLSDQTKDMLDTLASISKPEYAFAVLKELIKKQSSKKGYIPHVQYIKDFFKDDEYVSGLYSLQQAGIVDTKKNTINSAAVSSIRDALDYLKLEPVEGLKHSDKIRALLPLLGSTATRISGGTHNTISHILKNPTKFGNIGKYINQTLSDEELDDILNQDEESLKSNITHRAIHKIATGLGAKTVDELKQAIETKLDNLKNYKGDVNKQAIEDGRLEQLIKTFSI